MNSTYAYLLICRDFAKTSLVACDGDDVVGFVSGYHRPDRPSALFVWQVCVAKSHQKRGIAADMLVQLIQSRTGRLSTVEATVSPSNTASRRLFDVVAAKFNAAVTESPGFRSDHFGEESHEDEPVLRIGPII